MKTLLLFLIILNFSAHCNEETFSVEKQSGISGFEIIQNKVPLFVNRHQNNLFEVKFAVHNSEPANLQKIVIHFSGKSELMGVSGISAEILPGENDVFAIANQIGERTELTGNLTFQEGIYTIRFNFLAKETANLLSTFSLERNRAEF
jgi:hypothetical protein